MWGHNLGWNESLSFNLAYGKAVSDWRQPFRTTSSGCHHQSKPIRNFEQVAKKPEVAIPNPEEETSYTLLMVDPDAPSRDNPLARCVCLMHKSSADKTLHFALCSCRGALSKHLSKLDLKNLR